MEKNCWLKRLRKRFLPSYRSEHKQSRRHLLQRQLLTEALEGRRLFAGDLVPFDIARGIYFEQFEDGLPTAAEGWEYHSTNQGRIQLIDQRLQMDAARYGNSLNEAILHLNLEGLSGVRLSVDHDSIFDEDTAMPAIFSGHYNSDGIAISATV